MIDEVEGSLGTEYLLGNMSPEAQNQAKKLYALLTTQLRERPLQLLRAAEQGNGFEAWRLLTTTLAPASKSRSLALLGAITQFPAMNTTNVLEQLLRLEKLFRKYSQAAGTEVPKDFEVGWGPYSGRLGSIASTVVRANTSTENEDNQSFEINRSRNRLQLNRKPLVTTPTWDRLLTKKRLRSLTVQTTPSLCGNSGALPEENTTLCTVSAGSANSLISSTQKLKYSSRRWSSLMHRRAKAWISSTQCNSASRFSKAS